MSNGGAQSNNRPSREEYQRGLAGDIRRGRIEAPKSEDAKTPDVDVTPEELDEEEMEEEQGPQPGQENINEPAQQQRVEKTPSEQLKEGKVPEYEELPPEAYKQPPGGPALKAKTKGAPPSGAEEAARTGAKEVGKKAGGQIAEKAEQAVAQATKKAAQAVIKAAAKAGAKIAAATAEYWVPILIAAIALILIVVGVVMLIRAFQTPNANGASPVQAADVLDDHTLIQTVLALGDATEFQKMLDGNKVKLLADIDSFETEIKTGFSSDSRTAPTVAKIEEIKALIAAYTQPDAAKAKEIRDKLAEATKPWSVVLNPGGMVFPASGYNRDNISSDYRSPSRPDHRGIDIGMPIGTVFHAATSGKVVYVTDQIKDASPSFDLWHKLVGRYQNRGFGNTIIVKVEGSSNPNLNGMYWEIHHLMQGSASALGIKVGTSVAQGQIIGRSGHNGNSTHPHIHFQVDKVFCNGPCGKDRESDTIDPKGPLGW